MIGRRRGSGPDTFVLPSADDRALHCPDRGNGHTGLKPGRLEVRIDYEAREHLKAPAVGIAFYGGDGTCYTGTNTVTSGFEICSRRWGPNPTLMRWRSPSSISLFT